MKVADLILILQNCDPTDEIVVSKDAEGNQFSLMHTLSVDHRYSGTKKWDVNIGYRKLTEDLIELGFTDEDIIEHGTNCVVIWPI